MGLVVLGEHERRQRLGLAARNTGKLGLQETLQIELLLQPHRHGGEERPEPPGGVGKVGLQQTLELDQRLVVEDDVVEFLQAQSALLQAVLDGEPRETGVVLLAGEPLFLGRGEQFAVAQKRRRAVMVVR